nr:amino acid transporter [Corynebacterium capitovis]
MVTHSDRPLRQVRRDNFSVEPSQERTYPWWQVMCLSGVDYFSTLGYQPGIAVLAAGVLAPFATMILIAVTLIGVVPVYSRVAQRSPYGMGSVAMVEKLTRGWHGKVLVLVLLGFAATDFMVTITLSAADASAHLLGSDSSPHQMLVTLVLIAVLAIVFLLGFREAVTVAVVLVGAYLALTFVVVAAGAGQLIAHPGYLQSWAGAVHAQNPDPLAIAALSAIVFPKLALGLSGFETGVSVMPLLRAPTLGERIQKGRRLLLTSALLMSFFLFASSFLVATLIPAQEFAAGGSANGRALAWIADHYLGSGFGNVYGWVTTAILWFAGASAMSGMLALIPKYLPRFGMAPEWARRSRPIVVLLAAIAVLITVAFRADVEKQSGAYATGVLVVILSGAVAVTVTERGRTARLWFAAISLLMGLTLLANVIERPDGLHVAGFFIVTIVAVSFASRAARSYQLRENGVTFDEEALSLLDVPGAVLHLMPAAPCHDISTKEERVRRRHHLDESVRVVALEISVRDPSAFEEPYDVVGDGGVLRVHAASIANAVAVISLEIQRLTGKHVEVYFEWAPEGPLKAALGTVFLGRGQVATVTHEILRSVGEDVPDIHVA